MITGKLSTLKLLLDTIWRTTEVRPLTMVTLHQEAVDALQAELDSKAVQVEREPSVSIGHQVRR